MIRRGSRDRLPIASGKGPARPAVPTILIWALSAGTAGRTAAAALVARSAPVARRAAGSVRAPAVIGTVADAAQRLGNDGTELDRDRCVGAGGERLRGLANRRLGIDIVDAQTSRERKRQRERTLCRHGGPPISGDGCTRPRARESGNDPIARPLAACELRDLVRDRFETRPAGARQPGGADDCVWREHEMGGRHEEQGRDHTAHHARRGDLARRVPHYRRRARAMARHEYDPLPARVSRWPASMPASRWDTSRGDERRVQLAPRRRRRQPRRAAQYWNFRAAAADRMPTLRRHLSAGADRSDSQ